MVQFLNARIQFSINCSSYEADKNLASQLQMIAFGFAVWVGVFDYIKVPNDASGQGRLHGAIS